MTVVSNPISSADQRQGNGKTYTRHSNATCLEHVQDVQCSFSCTRNQLATALGESSRAQACVKSIAVTAAENIWIELKLNWDDNEVKCTGPKASVRRIGFALAFIRERAKRPDQERGGQEHLTAAS
ncbi:hypothetical protein BTVI_128713 [Pitangus sulphuratus]|nr:hypothetical protein BTVI_128713 [Pitangus sulphuratus]